MKDVLPFVPKTFVFEHELQYMTQAFTLFWLQVLGHQMSSRPKEYQTSGGTRGDTILWANKL